MNKPAETAPHEQWRLINPTQVLDMAVNDVEFLTELIDLFISIVPEQMQEIQHAIERQDAETLGIAAHGFKGTVGNYTQSGPYPLLQSLEYAGKSATLQDCCQKFALLEQEITHLVTELETLKKQTYHSVSI